jgi:hypothetical protein
LSPLLLKEKFQIGVLENSVLEGIFGLKTDEVTRGRRNCIDEKPKKFKYYTIILK